MKQRLSDVNALMRLLPSEEMVSKYTVANAPTVEAIPIDWIDGYIKQKIKVGGMYAEMLYIYDMLKEWEAENGK